MGLMATGHIKKTATHILGEARIQFKCKETDRIGHPEGTKTVKTVFSNLEERNRDLQPFEIKNETIAQLKATKIG